jgi:putative transferase (TIGR04331 family)
MYSVPIGPQVQGYLDDQLLFAAGLTDAVRADLLVRLSPQDYYWDIEARWQDADPSITLDSGQRDIGELLNDTRLYVATYNATTFLESFTQGIPTVIFWNPAHWELSVEAQPYFDTLRRALIFFDDPVACAQHVNSIWNDVPGWWASDAVQSAVEQFTARFAYVGPRPLRELRSALIKW